MNKEKKTEKQVKPKVANPFLVKIMHILNTYGVAGTYSGGNDSGSVDITAAPKTPGAIAADPDFIRFHHWLSDRVYDGLDYGSWAWDFDAEGTVTYNPKTKMIEVRGSHFENESVVEKESRALNLKELLGTENISRIDSLNILLSQDRDNQWSQTRTRLNVLHGEWTESLVSSETAITGLLNEIKNEFPGDEGWRYYLDKNITRSQLLGEPVLDISIGVVEDEPRSFDIDPKTFTDDYKEDSTKYDYE